MRISSLHGGVRSAAITCAPRSDSADPAPPSGSRPPLERRSRHSARASAETVGTSPVSYRRSFGVAWPHWEPPPYQLSREPVIRMSTSLLALCCQSGLVDKFATPMRARRRSIGSRSFRMSPLLIARFTSARIAPQTWS